MCVCNVCICGICVCVHVIIVCVCLVHEHVCVQEYMPVHICIEARGGGVGCPALLFSNQFLWDRSLELGWLLIKFPNLVSASDSAEVTGLCESWSSFYMDAEELNSGPYAHTASTSTHWAIWPSLQILTIEVVGSWSQSTIMRKSKTAPSSPSTIVPSHSLVYHTHI